MHSGMTVFYGGDGIFRVNDKSIVIPVQTGISDLSRKYIFHGKTSCMLSVLAFPST